MKRLLMIFSLVLGLSTAALTAQASAYQFTGQPLTIKHAGTHLTVNGYELLTSPTPAYDTNDTHEMEQYLIVHAVISLASSSRDEMNVYSSEYSLFSGPNNKDILGKSDHIGKLLKTHRSLLTTERSQLSIKNGHSRKIDFGFTVYPGNEYVLDADIGFDSHHDYVKLNQVKTTNGVTAD